MNTLKYLAMILALLPVHNRAAAGSLTRPATADTIPCQDSVVITGMSALGFDAVDSIHLKKYIIVLKDAVVLQSSQRLLLTGGRMIVLKPGFSARAGSWLRAMIVRDSCGQAPPIAAVPDPVHDTGYPGVRLYPNPASNYVIVEPGQQMPQRWQIRLFSTNGRAVISINGNAGRAVRLNTGAMPRGSYFLLLTDAANDRAVYRALVILQ